MRSTKIKSPVTKGIAKSPVILQLEALECGAASLAMVAAYYGKWITLETARTDCGVSRDGSSAVNIVKAARAYGFEVGKYRRSPESIRKKGIFPCIIHWNLDHFVVLNGFKGKYAYINDPAKGAVRVDEAYLNSMGINTNYGSNCYFPISDVAYSSGDKVAHKGGAPSKEMHIYMKTFDASSRNNDSTSKEVYNIHSCNEWRNRIETEYWSCVSYNKDAPSCKMLLFKAGSELSFPTTATQIINEKFSSVGISYRAHVQDIGWQNSVTSNGTNATTAGTTGCSLRMEGIKIDLKNKDGSSAVQYRAHVQKQGWHNSGELAGTEGQGLRMEALEIKLTGDYAKSYDVVYRVHCEDMGWTGWVKNGQTAGTTGQGLRMEAVEIKLVPKS